MDTQTTYRNAVSKTHHIPAPDWVSSGKARCGAEIPRPGFTSHTEQFGIQICKKCQAVSPGKKTQPRLVKIDGLRGQIPPSVQKSIEKIHAAHEERVRINTERAHKQRLNEIVREIQLEDHNRWLRSFGQNRIFID